MGREEALHTLEENADSLIDDLYTRPGNMRSFGSLSHVAKYWGVGSHDVMEYAQLAFQELVEEHG